MSQKTVYINGRFLTQPATGVQRYALELLRAWDVMLEHGEIDPTYYKLICVTPHLRKLVEEFSHIPIQQVGYLHGNLWEQIELPWHTRGEFLFNPCNIGPIFKLNQAVTIHDASVFTVPQSYSFFFKMKYRVIQSILAQTTKVVFTVSEHSKMELQKYCRVPLNKLFVIYEGCDHINRFQSDSSILRLNNIGDKPFILAVGSDAIHKNFSILEEVSAILGSGLDVIIAGGEFTSWFKAAANNTKVGIKRLGYINDGELKALYQNAAVFIFPSIYEGFGLPPLEAMTCGCPVICSQIPSLVEICGEAAIYFNPCHPGDLAEKIIRIINDKSLQEQLRRYGILQTSKFTWARTANSTWERLKDYLFL
jgi:glycosyltransferase involved in cell wall biosynthesis